MDASIERSKSHEEEAAAAALASLGEKKSKVIITAIPMATTITAGLEDDGDISDSEESYSSQNDVMPKAVHAPTLNSMMVDHTYTDYSVVAENALSFLEEGEDDHLTNLVPQSKKTEEKRILKIKKIFGEVGPSRKNSGGVVKPFPEKLMEVLDRSDMESIITWMPHGRAFIVLQPVQLKDIVLPRFFKQTKFMSFTRQLNLWGFKRITKGVDTGAYYHELFLRGRPRLAMLMRRQKIKGTGIKLTPNPETEPNFYKISDSKPLPAVDPSRKEMKPLPPLRHNNHSRPVDGHTSSYKYDDMVRRLNTRQPSSQFGDHQVYPFQAPNQMPESPIGNIMPQLNNSASRTSQDLLIQQAQQSFSNHHQQQPDANFFNMIKQRLMMEQQQKAHQQQQQQQQQQQILSAQELLSQVNGAGNMGGMQGVGGLKQRLLEAARSLDTLQQPRQNIMQPYPLSQQPPQQPQYNTAAGLGMNMGMGGMNGMNMNSIHQFMASQQAQQQRQQQQPRNSDTVAALMNALEDTRNVAYSTQARLQQVTRDLADVQNNNSNRHPM